MVAFTYRMPGGIAGNISRYQGLTAEPQQITPYGTTGAPTFYGCALVVDATAGNVGNMRLPAAGDTAASIYGVLIRSFPVQGGQADGLGNVAPPASGIIDVMKRGYMSVFLNGSTAAAKNGTVYVRIAAPSAGKVIGGFEAAADSSNTVTLTNAYFSSPADASGFVELCYNI